MRNLKITKCIFSGHEATPIINGIDAIEYFVTINNKKHLIRLSYYADQWPTENNFFKENQNIFYALLFNDDWFEDEQKFIEIEDLMSLLSRKIFPRTPEDKLEKLFLKLFSYQKVDGDLRNIPMDYYNNILWKILYFKSLNELNFYLEVLDSKGLIKANYNNPKYSPEFLADYRITFEGLKFAIKLKEEGDQSNKCFVAMSFSAKTTEIRKAIKEALENTSFIPIIMDEQIIGSEKTINDEIIASLKRCKFCIADFTFHSNGVYFESGFALGQGKKVIYTCRKNEFKKAHFDIRPLQHILYETEEQLKKELINKIEAWIK